MNKSPLDVNGAIATHAESMSAAERVSLANELLRMNRPTGAYKDEALRKNLGRWLRRTRKERGLTQEQMADHIGLSRPAYVNYEAGKQACTLEMFVVLCRTLSAHLTESLEEILNWPTVAIERKAKASKERK